MTNSTREIEKLHSDVFDTGNIAPKIVLTGSDGEDESFSERLMVYRDGNDSNFSQPNRIDHDWFKMNYDFEAFLDDYSFIHRLNAEVLLLKNHLFKLAHETRAPKKIGDIEQQIIDLNARDFDQLIKRVSNARSAKTTNKRRA